mmetsp:Transcript_10997/g.26454  ORF Transcript_10997/g.26454 Transcript_10997/m.26454 type:complete len:347 (-) Transcript_10997:139-1179(-)
MPINQENPAFIALVQASAGAAGAVFASLVLQPVEVAKTRIQISSGGDDSTLQTMRKIAVADGPMGLWLGAGGKCAENGAKNFAYFYIYDGLNAIVKQHMDVTTGVKLALGYIAGVGNTLINMPLEVISTKMQLDDAKGLGTLGMLRRILQEEGGVGALYTGLGYNIALCINPAIQNTILDKLKEAILLRMKQRNPQVTPALTAFQAFTLGAFAKAVATVVTYPLVRLKTNLQAGKVPQPTAERVPSLPKVNSKGMQRSGSIEMIRAMSFREDRQADKVSLLQRLIELYRGVGSALLKSTLQSALLYMVKDQVEFSVERLFHLTAQAFFRKSGAVKLGSFSGRPLAS